MIDAYEFMRIAVASIKQVLLDGFKTEAGQLLVDDEHGISVTVIVKFEYGNVSKTHDIEVRHSRLDDEYGVAMGADGDISKISTSNVLSIMYTDLAFETLEDQYFE